MNSRWEINFNQFLKQEFNCFVLLFREIHDVSYIGILNNSVPTVSSWVGFSLKNKF